MRTNFCATLTVMIMCGWLSSAKAQQYFRGEQAVIMPLQVMFENYTVIPLAPDASDDPAVNRFTKTNPYTFLQVIHDNGGKDYHILFQTNFLGKILLLAYSNNLSASFNGNRPLNVFVNCVKHINDHLSSVQNADAAIKCVIERLNYAGN